MEKKPIHIPALVTMIIGAVFAPLLSAITYPCCAISLYLCYTNRETHRVRLITVINILALITALVISVLEFIFSMGMIE